MTIIGMGAEASIIQEENYVLKRRDPKTYRIPILDKSLRKGRTKREVKIMKKLFDAQLTVPKIISADTFSFSMEFIDGKKVRDCLSTHAKTITKQIGLFIAKMHNMDIIHGDLTTSNMIYFEEKVYFIDFGLSVVSIRIEDKAVDLHLMRQALNSYHHEISDFVFENIISVYKKECVNASDVLKRLEEVEKRGRNKH